MPGPYYNARVLRIRPVVAWLAVLTLMAGVGLAQEQGERAAAVDPRLQPSIDKLEATLAELATLEASLRELDRTERQETAGYREDVALLEAEFQAADRRSAEVDALFDRVNPLVAWGLEEVRASIEIAQRPSALEKYTARLEKTVDLFGNSSRVHSASNLWETRLRRLLGPCGRSNSSFAWTMLRETSSLLDGSTDCASGCSKLFHLRSALRCTPGHVRRRTPWLWSSTQPE